MRILPMALVVSVVIHGGAIAWGVAHKIQPSQAVSAPPALIEVEVQPMAVALLDDHTVAILAPLPVPTPAVTPQTTHSDHALPTRPRTEISTGTVTRHPPEVATTQQHSTWLTMRDKDREKPPVITGPSGSFVEDFLAHGKPLQPKAIDSERIADDVQSREDHLHDPRWIANATPDEVTAERARLMQAHAEQDGHELQRKGTGYEAKHAVFNGEVEADGTAHLDAKRRYDPTEIIMNRHNIDPYASNKLRMLDQTRDERYEIGKAYKKNQLAQSAVIAQKNLAYLWARTTDVPARKQALFEMWDECAETGTDELVAGGLAARHVIVGFIKGRLTGDAAYTATELAAFNAKKKSSAAFDPYAD